MRTLLPWAVAAAALAVAAFAWSSRPRVAASGVLRYEIPLPGEAILPLGRGNPVAVSPDGKFIAYAAQASDSSQRIFLRASDELQSRVIPGSEYGTSPFFSPDGAWIAFTARGQLMRASVDGGAARALADVSAPNGGTWSPSGWLVMSSNTGTGLVKVPATGGAAIEFTSRDSVAGETAQNNPVALADGKTVLYSSWTMGGGINARIGVASLVDGSTTILDLVGYTALGVLDGNLIYTTAAGAVMAVPFDVGARRVTGPSIALLDQVAVDASNTTSYAQLAEDGTLIFVSGVSRRQMVFIAANGTMSALGEPGPYAWPRMSPDGKRLAVAVGSGSQRDVWIYNLPGGPFAPLTNLGSINDRPEWTPDGDAIVFRSNRSGRNAIWRQRVDGSSPAEPILELPSSQVDEGVLSADGRYIVIQRDSTGNGELWYRLMQGDTALHRVEPNNAAYAGRFSPDGKWLVYATGEAGAAQVFARSFPSLTTRVQVSPVGGSTPIWSPDGRRVYYADNGQLWVANVGTKDPLTFASRSLVLARGFTFNSVHADFDIAPDGRILALQSPDQQQQLVVVRNFGAELRARVQGTPR